VGLLSFLRGDALLEQTESRALPRPDNEVAHLDNLPSPRSSLLNVTTGNALAVADAYACVRVLADAVASLPPKVYRRTPAGRVPAGDDQRLVQLLRQPSPGSTSADLFSQAMCHLNVHGEAFIGKYRAEGAIVQLALLHPSRMRVELRSQRIVYQYDSGPELGPEDVLHVKGMSSDGLRGLSPVTQCRLALSVNSNMQEFAKSYFERGSRPAGFVKSPMGWSREGRQRFQEHWHNRHGGVENMHRIALLDGDLDWVPMSFSPDDSQFLEQRELSTREVCRIFRVPAHLVDGSVGSSLTYTNASQFNRYFLDYSLMPWLVRLERAFSNDPELCPGGAYLQFSLDAFLRPDPDTRSQIYPRALDPEKGWMTRAEVRELEDLSPEDVTPNE
jgi:HK97 family phage portal protein